MVMGVEANEYVPTCAGVHLGCSGMDALLILKISQFSNSAPPLTRRHLFLGLGLSDVTPGLDWFKACRCTKLTSDVTDD